MHGLPASILLACFPAVLFAGGSAQPHAVPRPAGVDVDSDRDGLSDFQERHKYGTNPESKDSDGDGIPDGDWQERREYTYTIRTVIQVMPTYDKETLNDDFQDCRVLHETEQYIELEVLHYPLNTCAQEIEGRKDWKRSARAMNSYTKAGVTTNFDKSMQRDLIKQLKEADIDVAILTDKEIVEQVSVWALGHAKSIQKTCAWSVDFDTEGQPVIPAALTSKFQNSKGESSWTDAEQFEHELYGKGMFENGTRGTCTTSANYLTTVLRAVGIPTRSIVTIPAVDASDPRNMEMVEQRLTNHVVRAKILEGLRSLKDSFAAHTYNEVWLDGRWRRLNYSHLGQNTLDANYMGLMTRVHTFEDLSQAGLARGWGLGRKEPSDVFRYSNPYTCLTISDLFGVHSQLDNLPVVSRDSFHVAKAYWFDSEDRPSSIGSDWHGVQDPSHGHIMFEIGDCNEQEDAKPFKSFFERADQIFLLRAEGEEELRASALQNWWNYGHHLYVRMDAGEYRRMKKGVSYQLVARNSVEGLNWVVDEITLRRE